MDYEKKYKALVESIKTLKEANPSDEGIQNWVKDNVPELKESEDNMVRKAIINVFGSHKDYEVFFGVSVKDILAWLEKQGEPTDINLSEFDLRLNKLLKQFETLPKEELANCLSFYLNVVQNDGTYKAEEKQGEQKPIPDWMPKFLDELRSKKNYFDWDEHKDIEGGILAIIKWMNPNYFNEKDGEQKVEPKFKVGDTMRTLQEAKDGWTDGMPFVVSIDSEYYNCNSEKIAIKDQDKYEYPPMNRKHDVCDTCDEKASCINPCPTKLIEEQNPADKIEPKFKIGDTIIKKHNSDILYFGSFTITDITGGKYWYNDRIICDITEQDEWELNEPVRQNTAKWSEEDNAMLISIENILIGRGHSFHDKEINWLKSLKGRVQSQTKQEWSEEDEKMLKDTIRFCELCGNQVSANWLKSLRPQNNITDEELAQAKKDAYNDVLDKLEYDSENPTFDDGWSAAIWYLKKRNAQPQNRWKPSDAQMASITCAVRKMKESACYDSELVSLLNDLKKL